ncbi:MAG TPA: alpha/beta hydrolase [Chthoniobacterales bacterium]
MKDGGGGVKRSGRPTLAIRLAFAATLLLFAWSLLVFFRAPTAVLWIAAILIGEWGHYAALLAFALAALTARRGRLGSITAVLALITAAICLSPMLRAKRIASTLPERCTAAFGEARVSSTPFRFAELLGRERRTDIAVTEHVYATDGSKQLKLDLYRRGGTTDSQPIVIMLHGGSWNGGNKAQLAAANTRFARQGYTLAAINYRHAPKWSFPAAVDDVFRALDYLKSKAGELHLDPTRIALIGRSAGGQLALSAAYSGREPNIRAVAAFYAPADLVLGYNEPSRRWVLDSQKVLQNYLGGSPAENPAGYAAASPINFVGAATPPTLLIHGLLDPMVWPKQSRVLAAKLADAGRPHLLLELPWATHGCEANTHGPSAQLSFYAVDRLVAAAFAAP